MRPLLFFTLIALTSCAVDWRKLGMKVGQATVDMPPSPSSLTTLPETWKQGDPLVMTRLGGNHVCLFDQIGPKYKYANCLGGNLADSVNITAFPLSHHPRPPSARAFGHA